MIAGIPQEISEAQVVQFIDAGSGRQPIGVGYIDTLDAVAESLNAAIEAVKAVIANPSEPEALTIPLEVRAGMAKPIEIGLVLEREDARHFHEYMKQPTYTDDA